VEAFTVLVFLKPAIADFASSGQAAMRLKDISDNKVIIIFIETPRFKQ
jgi:hypothetical protein